MFTVPYLLHFCFLHDSARWLKTLGRTQEALDAVKLMARVDCNNVSDHILSEWKSELVSDNVKEQPNLFPLFKSWLFVRITLLAVAIWSCVYAVSYGLTFYITNLGRNIYANALISSALEFSALLFVYLSLDTKLGRNYNVFLLFLVSGIMFILIIFVLADMTWLRISFAQIGRLSIAAAFAILYISTAEIFPTRMWTICLAICCVLSSLSTVVSPYLAGLSKFRAFIPPMLFGGAVYICCLNVPTTYTSRNSRKSVRGF